MAYASSEPDVLSPLGCSFNSTTPVTILLIGKAGAGKTSLARRMVGRGYAENPMVTVGFEYLSTTITLTSALDLPRRCRVSVYDCVGSDHCLVVHRDLLQRADAAIVVCDATRDDPLERAQQWATNLLERQIPALVALNKVDLLAPKVLHTEASGMIVEERNILPAPSPLNPAVLDVYCEEVGFVGWHLISARCGLHVGRVLEHAVHLGLLSRGDPDFGAASALPICSTNPPSPPPVDTNKAKPLKLLDRRAKRKGACAC
jgi:signal recognition particle receptor subunit beta